MRSLIYIEVEHGETTDGLNEALFDMGVGSALNPLTDDQWPTADDGGTWPRVEGGIDYRVLDYAVRVDLPECFVLDHPEIPKPVNYAEGMSDTDIAQALIDCGAFEAWLDSTDTLADFYNRVMKEAAEA